MVSDADAAKFDEFKAAVVKNQFDDLPGGAAAVDARPLLFTSFMQVGGGPACLIIWVDLCQAGRAVV
jgi:hypothetical protein